MELSAYDMRLDLIVVFPLRFFSFLTFLNWAWSNLLPDIVTIFHAPIYHLAMFLILQTVQEYVHMSGGLEDTSTDT